MESVDLASLLGPTPVFLTKEQVEAISEQLARTENGVAVMLLNEGGMSVTARFIVGERPIPTESEIVNESEIVVSASGTTFPTGGDEDKIEQAVTDAQADAQGLVDAAKAALETLPYQLQ